MLDGGDHQVLHIFGGDAASRRHMPHRFAVTAVEREGDAHLLAIVAGDLQPVGAPAGVALVDRDPTIVTSFFPLLTVALEEQPVHLHDAVDTLCIGRCAPGRLGLTAQQCQQARDLDP